MKLEFERPDYCKGCTASELRLNSTVFYSNVDGRQVAVESINSIACKHDAACKQLHDRLVADMREVKR